MRVRRPQYQRLCRWMSREGNVNPDGPEYAHIPKRYSLENVAELGGSFVGSRSWVGARGCTWRHLMVLEQPGPCRPLIIVPFQGKLLGIGSTLSQEQRGRNIQIKMGLERKNGRSHKVQGHVFLITLREKQQREFRIVNLEELFWPLLPPKSRQKLIYLHMSKGKSMQSNEDNEEQNKFPMAWEARGKACAQSRWELRLRIP